MIVARSVNVPGWTHRVNAEMYEAMHKAVLKVLPRKAPGLTQQEMIDALKRVAPRRLFPDGGRVSWWMKTVQLDLEAKKVLVREKTKPLRWHRIR
jgi:hypothetical protein